MKKFSKLLFVFSILFLVGTNKTFAISQGINNSTVTKQYEGIQQTFLGSDLPENLSDIVFDLGIGTTSYDYYLSSNSFIQNMNDGSFFRPDTVNGLPSGNNGNITGSQIHFHWNTPVTINSANTYRFVIANGNVGYNISIGGSDSDTYAGGSASWGNGSPQCFDPSYNSNCSETGIPVDLAFSTDVAPISDVEVVYPAPNSSIGDFNNWVLDINIPVTETLNQIVITYDDFTDISYTYGGELTKYVPKGNLLAVGNHNIQVSIYSSGGNLVTETGISLFSIVLLSASGDPLPPDVTCEGGNWVSDNFCKVLRYLFVPSTGTLNNFKILFEPLSDKIPFSYFNELKTAILGLDSSTAPTFDLNIPDNMQNTIFTPFRTALNWILWLLFGVWVFKRLNNFNL